MHPILKHKLTFTALEFMQKCCVRLREVLHHLRQFEFPAIVALDLYQPVVPPAHDDPIPTLGVLSDTLAADTRGRHCLDNPDCHSVGTCLNQYLQRCDESSARSDRRQVCRR